jgi:organic hydroperoxide reductase OsmC/OhrA
MSEYTAHVRWQRGALEAFTDNRYSRRHEIAFDGGAVVPGSSSPGVVPLPLSDASAVDPEEMFVASLSSCHMLWFLSLAAGQGYRVERYEDEAAGVMQRNAEGRIAMTRVTLRPRVQFVGERQPDAKAIEALHHEAHERCFIANSVKTDVQVQPQP